MPRGKAAQSTAKGPTQSKTAKKIAALLSKHEAADRRAVIKEAMSTVRMVDKLLDAREK